MLSTNYNKAAGAGVGVALGTLIAYFWPMPPEVQGAVTLLCSAGLTALFPKNKGA